MFKMLLLEENQINAEDHQCIKFTHLVKGDFKNETEKLGIKEYPTTMRNELKGRRQEMFDLISRLAEGNRLTQLVGLAGIGKSCLVRAAIKFLADRRTFLGGIIFV